MTVIEDLSRKVTLATDPSIAPPPGIKCDCPDPENHFHYQNILVVCAKCTHALHEDFFVYTREDGVLAINEYCQFLGWKVNGMTYLCDRCFF